MKKLLGLFISFIFSFSMYAQSAKSVGLTDSDVKNWSKNCVSIQKEFEKIGIDVEEELSVSDSEKISLKKFLLSMVFQILIASKRFLSFCNVQEF